MNNLNLLKEFMLREQELLILVKPIALILLYNETKKELVSANRDYNSYLVSKNSINPVGEDIYQNNAINLAKSFYDSNIEDTQEHIESLKSIIEILQSKLSFNNNQFIHIEKLAYERRREIEWLFDTISTKNKVFQISSFQILKN